MKRIRLYRHHECEKCAGYARQHHRLDWLDRFEDSTATPATGPLRMGEIVVEDLSTGKIYRGIECMRLLFKQIPLYWLFLPLTYLPPVRTAIEKEVSGCGDNSCSTQ